MSRLSYCLKKDARYFWKQIPVNVRPCTWNNFMVEYEKLNKQDMDLVYDAYIAYLNYLFKEDPTAESELFTYFEQNFYKLGFCEFQKELEKIDDLLIRNVDCIDDLAESINNTDPELVATVYAILSLNPDAIAGIKCFCRFGKRFTWRIPFGIKIFQRAAYDSLLENNERCKQLNRGVTDQYSSRYIISRMKPYIRKVEEAFFDLYEEPDPYVMDHVFIPNGSNYEGYKTQSQKLSALVKRSWGVFPQQLCTLPEQGARFEYLNAKNPVTGRKHVRVNKCRFASVPKSYKNDRGISLMETTNTSLSDRAVQVLMDCLSRATSGAIQIFDQEQNRTFCMNAILGYNDLATIDLSSASDLISYNLVKELFSPRFLEIFEEYRADYVEYTRPNGKRNSTLLHLWSLMGEKDTFPLECIVFWSLYRACYDIYNDFQDSSFSCVDIKSLTIYGDDGICDSRVVPIVLHFMQELGMKPNRTKSYYDEQVCPFMPSESIRFRESCGVDVLTLNGFITILPQLYLPRGGFKSGNYLIVQLIDMQHRAIECGADVLSDVLVDRIASLLGGHEYLTYSLIGEDHQDIWCHEKPKETYWYTYAPSEDGVKRPYTFRYLHMAFTDVKEITDNSQFGIQCANWYCYQEFLRMGPSYEDPLLELLGVSTRRVTPGQLRSESRDLRIEYKEVAPLWKDSSQTWKL